MMIRCLENLKKQEQYLLIAMAVNLPLMAIYTLFWREASIKVLIVHTAIVFAMQLYFLAKRYQSFFSPMLLFLVSFYIFQNGQLLLYALNIPFYDYYISLVDDNFLSVVMFSSYSNLIAGFAAMCIDLMPTKLPKFWRYPTYHHESNIKYNALLGVLGTGFVAFVLIILKLVYVMMQGYTGVRLFEGSIPSIIILIEFFYFPFSLMVLIYEKRPTNIRKMVKYAAIAWSLLTAITGDRTTGIAGFLVISLLEFKVYQSPKAKWGNLRLVGVGVFLMIMTQVALAIRTQVSLWSAFFGEHSIFIAFFSELGFSWFPLFAMMQIVPNVEAYQLGSTYLSSLIGGFFPSSLDILHLFDSVKSNALIFEKWYEQHFTQFDFGLGFSLNAEAYINFGSAGLVAIFVVVGIVAHFLGRKIHANSNPWKIYQVLVLLYFWFTLPRRSSYYIWNAIFYSVIMMRIYVQHINIKKIIALGVQKWRK